MNIPCEREAELLELVSANAWPGRADANLRVHVDGCDACRELVAVVTALSASEATAVPAPRVPDARLVWHRAQIQARQESARRAARPVLYAQIAAGAIVLLLLVLWSDFGGALQWLARGTGAVVSATVEMTAPIRSVFDPSVSTAADSTTRPPLGYIVLFTVALGALVLGAAAGVSRLIDRSS